MPANAVVRHVVTFGRVLREVGVEVGPGRVADALRGLDNVELERQDDVYWTLRQTLVSRREDLESFDIAFDSWFLGAAAEPQKRRVSGPPQGQRRKGEPGPGPEIDGGVAESGGWNDDELLRTKDFGAMTPEEHARARKLIQGIALARPRRHTRRLRPDAKGHALDVRGLVRASLSTGGDPVQRAFRSRGDTPRKLVLILDVSGSMDAYARAMLLYMHALLTQVAQTRRPLPGMHQVIGDALGEENVTGVAAIHHPLRHVDAGPGDVGAPAHIGHLAHRSAVNPHPHRNFRMLLKRFGDLQRASGRFFHAAAEDQRHPITGR